MKLAFGLVEVHPRKRSPGLNPVAALHLAPAVGQPEVSIRTAILAGVEITGGLE